MTVYAFGPYVLDVAERRLTRDGRVLPLSHMSFEILRLLVEAGGRLVDRQTFNARLWAGATVEDRNLTVHVSNLRKALNGAGPADDCIQTVARTGYRLAMPVNVLAPTDRAAIGSPQGEPVPLGSTRQIAPAAQPLLLQAQAHLDKGERVAALKALALFERVLALDSASAAAHAGLAATYLLLTSSTVRRPLPLDEALRLARDHIERALALDDRLAPAWVVKGRLKMYYEWDWRGAEVDFQRAVSLAPDSAEAADCLGRFLSAMGRHEQALTLLENVHRLHPLRRQTLEYLGFAHWMASDAEQALAAFGKASAIDPEARRPHFCSIFVLDQVGRHDEAMATRAVWLGMFGDAALARRLAVLQRDCGWHAAMTEWIAFLERLNQWWEAAVQRMALDERVAALAAVEHSIEERSDGVPFMLQVPSLRPLHQEPQFQRLIRAVNLPITA